MTTLDDNIDIFLIRPVRNVTPQEQEVLQKYVKHLEEIGYTVYDPIRDTNQNDQIGLEICRANRRAIEKSRTVHVYFNPTSTGSLFDLGMVFMAEKPIVLVNRDILKQTPQKSFTNVLLEMTNPNSNY